MGCFSMQCRARRATYFRNFIFGVEDSLVSTVGLLSGVALSGVEQSIIILSGVILIFVEGFSMAAGAFISERAGEEFEAKQSVPALRSFATSFIMLISYILSGFIPLAPYLFFDVPFATILSIVAALVALFILGSIGAFFSKTSIFARGSQALAIGGVAILIGVLAGHIVGAV